MKDLLKIAAGIVIGLLVGGVIYLVSSQPRGSRVQLIPPPTPAPLTVHVAGAVNHPGVFQLPQNSRVQDAIRAAGGMLPEANADALNLAALLQDGDRVLLPTNVVPAMISTSDPGSSRLMVLPSPDVDHLVNINTASQAELETLPGIGPITAQKIIVYREQHGPFETIEDLVDVPGIGPKTLDDIRLMITVNP